MKKLWIGIAVAAAIGLVVFASLKGGGGKAKVKVYAEAATRRDLTRVVKASGQINPRIKVNISAHVIGKISRLFVKEGDRIEVGKPFLELEKQAFTAFHDDAAARLAMAETERHQAEVAAADAEVKLARAKRLSGEGISSRKPSKRRRSPRSRPICGSSRRAKGSTRPRQRWSRRRTT